MKVILSIKPQFAEKIFEGTKKFEFRRTLFKNKAVTKIVVYASAPISRVVGEFEIEEILHTDLHFLWNNTEKYAGISKEYYNEYFNGKEMGYAIKIKETRRYEQSYSIEEKYGIKAPQSFAYIS